MQRRGKEDGKERRRYGRVGARLPKYFGLHCESKKTRHLTHAHKFTKY